MSIRDKRLVGLLTVILIALGVILIVILVRQPTQKNQEAFGVSNINTGSEITSTNNKDGTMGPESFSKDFSASLSNDNLGSLTFSVTDPTQNTFPTGLPSPTTSQTYQPAQGPQPLKSLVVKFNKIEVHLVSYGKNSNSQKQEDKWETLDMPVAMSVDLVQLTGGGTANLGLTKLAAGKYTQVRLYIANAQAVLQNGRVVNPQILSKDKTVRVVEDFMIASGQNTNLIIDFDAQHSLILTGNTYELIPVVTKLLVIR